VAAKRFLRPKKRETSSYGRSQEISPPEKERDPEQLKFNSNPQQIESDNLTFIIQKRFLLRNSKRK
ncbi:hypothetical protein, partial [Cytobacillus oceanisediminis]|uniref:hypothetical protein n=1 Tax=Cytobacillus oceanisediminis TaxID=665099 RepID=UPI001C92BEDD